MYVIMTEFDPKLGVLVSGNEIVVVLTGSIYTANYFKPRGQPWLAARTSCMRTIHALP